MKHIKRYESFLNKDVYLKKLEYSANKNKKNKENKSLTDEQHDIIAKLCSVRHELHSNINSIVKSDENAVKKSLIGVNIQLEESGLEPMSFIPTDFSDFIDIDTIEELEEIEEPSEEDRDDWYDENFERIYEQLEKLNTKIENYLTDIDTKYGTNYCPSGLSRKN